MNYTPTIGISKNTYKTLFALLAVALMLLPFVNVFNYFLTRVVENSGIYRPVQTYVVPHVVKLVMVILRFFGIKTRWGQTMFLIYTKEGPLSMQVTWNCLGWQSLVIVAISLLTGLSGNYTLISKIECILIGILGTFLINLGRVVFTTILLVVSRPLFAFVLHDYLMILVTIIWLFVFWWFSYSCVLDPSDGSHNTRMNC